MELLRSTESLDECLQRCRAADEPVLAEAVAPPGGLLDLSCVFYLCSDPKASNSQLTQEQLAVLLNFLGQPSSAVNATQFVQSTSAKVSQDMSQQQLAKNLPPADQAEPLPPPPPPPPPPQAAPNKPPQPAAPSGVPRTPPMPKPPSPLASAPPGMVEGEAAVATQTAVTMLLAQLLQAQQGQRTDRGDGGDASDGGNTAAAGGVQAPPPEVKQPPEPSPVSPGT